jgi:hypothetical protein
MSRRHSLRLRLVGAGSLFVLACSSSTSSTKDAGKDGSGAARDATSEGAQAFDASDGNAPGMDGAIDVTGLPTLDSGGPSTCHGTTDCSQGYLCCLDVQAIRAPASCVEGISCPTNEAELCGIDGDEKCKAGVCADYQCTFQEMHEVIRFFACGVPLSPTVSCGVIEPGVDAGSGSGS